MTKILFVCHGNSDTTTMKEQRAGQNPARFLHDHCYYPIAVISFWISSKRPSSVAPARPASANSSLSGSLQRIFSGAPILATMAASFFGVTLLST